MSEEVGTGHAVMENVAASTKSLPDGRYLLFDSGCGACTEIASTIEQEANGWLNAKSLQQDEVQETLAKAIPNWKWKPSLLEVSSNGEQTRVHTGLSMKARMVLGVGPTQALRMWSTAQELAPKNRSRTWELNLAASTEDPSRKVVESARLLDRRTVLKMGAAGLAVAFASTLPGLSGRALATEASEKLRIKQYSASEAFRVYRRNLQVDEVATVHRDLIKQGFSVARETAGGFKMFPFVDADGNDVSAQRHVAVLYKNGSRTATLYVQDGPSKAGNDATTAREHSVAYSVSTNGGKGVEVWGPKGNKIVKLANVPNYRKEYRRVTGHEPFGASTNGSGEQVFTAQAFGVCTVCQGLAGFAIGSACTTIGAGATLSVAALIAGSATCGPAVPICVTVAGIVAGAGCGVLLAYKNSPFEFCQEYAGLC